MLAIELTEQQLHLLELQAKGLDITKEELATIYLTSAIEKTRLQHIKDLKGKYRDSLSSTEEFIKRKQDEIEIEERRN